MWEGRPMTILVSECLLGIPCRYDGKSRPMEGLELLQAAGHTLIPVCPETLGGLPTPRPPAERQPDGRVVNRAGEDVTASYEKGAQSAAALALEHGCRAALLKAKSPSCGSGKIYDGTFSGQLTGGWGVTAELLDKLGLLVVDEDSWRRLLEQWPPIKNPSKAV